MISPNAESELIDSEFRLNGDPVCLTNTARIGTVTRAGLPGMASFQATIGPTGYQGNPRGTNNNKNEKGVDKLRYETQKVVSKSHSKTDFLILKEDVGEVYLSLTPSTVEEYGRTDTATASLEFGLFENDFFDHFADGILDPRWKSTTSLATLVEQSNRLELTATSIGGQVSLSLNSDNASTPSFMGRLPAMIQVKIDDPNNVAGNSIIIEHRFRSGAKMGIELNNDQLHGYIDNDSSAAVNESTVTQAGDIYVRFRMDPSEANFFVEYSTDGTSWNTLASTTTTNWYTDEASTLVLTGQNSSSTGLICALDDFQYISQDAQIWFGTSSLSNFAFGKVGANAKAAQRFVPKFSGFIDSITLLVGKSATPTDDIFVTICNADGTPAPDETSVLGTSSTFSGSSIPGGGGFVPNTFTFSTPIFVQAGVSYFFVLQRSGALSSSAFFLSVVGTTANAYGYTNLDSTTSIWAALNSGALRHNFQISGSQIDTLQAVETQTVYFALTPSGDDIGPTNADTATEILALTPSASFAELYNDLNTENFKLTPSSSDSAAYVEAPPDIYLLDWSSSSSSQSLANPLTWVATSFVAPTGLIRSVELVLKKTGSPVDDVIVELRTDNGFGEPSSTVLASTVLPAANVQASAQLFEIPFSIALLISSPTALWLTARRSGVTDAGNRINVLFADVTSASYETHVSPDGGSSWGVSSLDMAFGIRYTPEPTDIIFSLTPSATETAQFVDAATEALALTPSITEEYGHSDADTELFKLTPSGTDVLEAGSVDYLDANTEYLGLVPSSTDVAVFVDANTEVLTLVPSATETGQFVDAATESFSLIPSGSDIFAGLDAATENFALTPSGADIAEYVDSGREDFRLTPASTDALAAVDANTELLALIPSSVDTAQYVDSAIELLHFMPSADESVSGQTLDSATETLSLIPSSTDVEDYHDSNTEIFTLLPSADETRIYDDSNTEIFLLTPSYVDVAQFVDINTETLNLTPSAAEFQTHTYVDADTELFSLLPSGNEIPIYTDTDIERLILTPSSDDFRVIFDSATETLSLVPSSTDIAEFIDVLTVLLAITPSGDELLVGSQEDIGTLYLHLTPGGIEVKILVQLVARLYSRYTIKLISRYAASIGYRRWLAREGRA